MLEVVTKLFKKINNTLNLFLAIGLVLFVVIAIYSFSQPAQSAVNNNATSTQIGTTYAYKATVSPNILYPAGGTVPVGETIVKKITTAIPIDLKSTINAAEEVIVKGTHEVQLVVKAQDLWEKRFPLEQKQSFEQQGTEISIIDSLYTISLNELNAFITQVEEETGITPSNYTLEVEPNLVGTISYAGIERELLVQDKLVFQYAFDSIILASEKAFTSTIPFGTAEVITNTFTLAGVAIPLATIRTASTMLSLLLILAIFFFNKTSFVKRKAKIPSEIDTINKKYGNRIIQVSNNENLNQKSIISLTSFKSIVKIADEKELPIFFHTSHQENQAIYFIVDGNYVYNFETAKIEVVRSAGNRVESHELYAKN